jgi:AcrR family transcriptional regulator
MAVRDSKTEELIKDAAKKLFFVEGRFNATTQEIADAAGVNRTLVNYYFRSRDTLFSLVLSDARVAMRERMETFLAKATDLKSKLSHVIDFYMEQALEYPYIDTYMITRMNEDTGAQEEGFTDSKFHSRIKIFLQEIEQEMDKGNIRKMSPQQFYVNFVALLSNPVCFAPMYKKMLNLSDKQYKNIIKERKEIILGMLFTK